MNQEEAKRLLSLQRDCDPTSDQDVIEARALLARSPELRAWYNREQECIEALDAKLREIAPPRDLRARILASLESAQPTPLRWYRRRSFQAVAALLLLSLLGGVLWLKRPYTSGGTNLAAYQKDMTTYLDRFFLLDFESDKLTDVTDWLARTRNINNFEVPASLANHPSLGCEVIAWNGRLSYLICFDVEGELYHLFLLPGGADLDTPLADPRYAVDPKWSTASWTAGNDLYFCCSLGNTAEFRRILHEPGGSPPHAQLPTSTHSASRRAAASTPLSFSATFALL